MSFLRKLLRKNGEDEKVEFVDRPPRVHGGVLKNIFFQMEVEGKMVAFFLKNISQNGVGVLPAEMQDKFKSGEEIKAFLKCDDLQVDFRLQVVHINNNGILGAKVVDNNIDYALLVKRYFKIELAAMEASVVRADKLAKDPDGTPIWFTSGDNCEFFLVTNEQNVIVRYHLSMFGFVIQRDKKAKISFKQIWSDNATETAYKASDTLKDVEADFPVHELVNNGISYLSMLMDLDTSLKEAVEKELQQSLRS